MKNIITYDCERVAVVGKMLKNSLFLSRFPYMCPKPYTLISVKVQTLQSNTPSII